MIQIEESNPSFESCGNCIHYDDSEEMCILRRCIHAVAQLKECYVPKQPTIEPDLQPDGTLVVNTSDYDNVRRALVQHGTDGTLFYADETKQRWISCSDRLPEKNGRYLVTRGLNAAGAIWNRVYIVNYSDLMGLKDRRIFWQGNVGKSDFEKLEDVIAWMPLPEPYREGEG